VQDQPIHQRTTLTAEGRIGDDRIDWAIGFESQGIPTFTNLAFPDATQAESLQVPDQIAFTGAWLREAEDAGAAQVRDQWHHCGPRSRVEVSRMPLEVGPFTHISWAFRSDP
jgi:hypothetical protein